MAPPKEISDELKFVMTCIKYSETELKPNFDEVARETGAKSASACYHRLWGIKKKLGLTGSGNKKNAASPATPSTGGRKRKAAPAKTKKESTGGDEHDIDEATPTKKRNTKKQDTKKQAVVKDEEDGDSLEAEAGSVDTGDIGDLDSGDEEE
ncbi:hypothetical protein LTR99_002152 [Exophiala xenobiotica]|uniref:Myb-like DNA-binding domain-containing protein n=1 Tax=Vermiconidia calcicola TaxID=1690605 RepID=A0AAV9QKM3_9PEZI|nr:hypothetical protein H2202_010236 [Exophiala xenobiotica]KAK5539152.1 hypothetical protein LTR23_006766 [Chaetothyriales sp. CCFEE 6169]KAK5542510.1 hypothetical protein LTR25_002396 [Vermiconidia calcicola]KAK5195626.1 hypothetical protein LTR92_004566 [Exophiala xenobiotica]KAK5226070.1 hypothetical protein LTR72_003974 [Exophiala xenobiotica]